MLGKRDSKDVKITRFSLPEETEFWFGVDAGYLTRAHYQGKSSTQ